MSLSHVVSVFGVDLSTSETGYDINPFRKFATIIRALTGQGVVSTLEGDTGGAEPAWIGVEMGSLQEFENAPEGFRVVPTDADKASFEAAMERFLHFIDTAAQRPMPPHRQQELADFRALVIEATPRSLLFWGRD